MATKNSKAVKAIENERNAEAGAFVIEEADEAMPTRTRKPGETRTAALAAVEAAHATLNNGESRPFRVSGEGAEKLIGALRIAAKDRYNMTIRTAPSAAAPGAMLWQLLDKAPTKRTRTVKS